MYSTTAKRDETAKAAQAQGEDALKVFSAAASEGSPASRAAHQRMSKKAELKEKLDARLDGADLIPDLTDRGKWRPADGS